MNHPPADRQPGHLPPMDRSLLRGFERLAVPMLEFVNRQPGLRTALHGVIGTFNAAWIEASVGVTWQIHDLQQVLDQDAPGGIIMVSNHRSFFDMFVISTVINRRSKLLRQVMYPVRSEFFYTSPLGVALNLAISGASMWPPVFRDDRRRLLNPIGMDQIAATLTRGVGIGLHPEGRRSKGDDPYTFLPLKPGLGQLLQRCDPSTLIVPVFIAGLSNDAGRELRRSRQPAGQRGEPVRIRFGAPLRVGQVHATGLDVMGATEHVMAHVRGLAEQDREQRASDPTMV